MKKFLAIICSIFLVITICSNIFLVTAEKLFAKENIEKGINSIDFNSISEEMFDRQEFYQSLEEIGLTQDQAQKILNAPIIKETTSNVINNALDYYIRGEESAQVLTKDQMDKILKEVIILCEDVSDGKITQEMEEEIYDYANPIIEKVQEKLPTIKELEQQDSRTSNMIELTKTIFSKEVKIGLTIVSVILIFLIYLLRRKDHTYFFWYGVNGISASVILLSIFFFTKMLFSVNTLGQDAEFVVVMFESFIHNGFVYAIILFCISLMFFIANHFLRNYFSKKIKQKEKVNA